MGPRDQGAAVRVPAGVNPIEAGLTWRHVVPGEVIEANGVRWTVVSRDGGEITMRRNHDGFVQVGSPPPDKPVTHVGPKDIDTAARLVRHLLGGKSID